MSRRIDRSRKKNEKVQHNLIFDYFIEFLFCCVEIDYSSVRRMPTVKFSGQNQVTTTNPMSTSTSLQDISAHHQQNFSWNNYLHHQNAKDQQLIRLSK